MKKIVFILFFTPFFLNAQPFDKNTIVGKWATCRDTAYNPNFICNNKWDTEFKNDGTVIYSDKERTEDKYKWDFKNNSIILTCRCVKYKKGNKVKKRKTETGTVSITIINKDLFYVEVVNSDVDNAHWGYCYYVRK